MKSREREKEDLKSFGKFVDIIDFIHSFLQWFQQYFREWNLLCKNLIVHQRIVGVGCCCCCYRCCYQVSQFPTLHRIRIAMLLGHRSIVLAHFCKKLIEHTIRKKWNDLKKNDKKFMPIYVSYPSNCPNRWCIFPPISYWHPTLCSHRTHEWWPLPFLPVHFECELISNQNKTKTKEGRKKSWITFYYDIWKKRHINKTKKCMQQIENLFTKQRECEIWNTSTRYDVVMIRYGFYVDKKVLGLLFFFSIHHVLATCA